MVKLKHKVHLAVVKNKREDECNSLNTILGGLKLEESMVGKELCCQFIPSEPSHQKCPWCDRFSLITVVEDEGAEERNDTKYEKYDQYDRLVEIWSAFQAARDVTNNEGRAPLHLLSPSIHSP